MANLDPGDPANPSLGQLRHRHKAPTTTDTSIDPATKDDHEQVIDKGNASSNPDQDTRERRGPLGKTPGGTVFQVPETHDMISSLFDPRYKKSVIDVITLFLLGLQTVLFFVLPVNLSRPVFLLSFAFWRLAYNAGLGWILTKQSKTRWIVKAAKKSGWFDFETVDAEDPKKSSQGAQWMKREFEKKMGKDYDVNAVPLEFNTWLAFRWVVNIILLNDFLSYLLYTLTYLRFPGGSASHSTAFHLLRWIGGITLLLFNLWVKVDAHRIVKDYAWYWGDAFFLSLQNLVFDGVFELAPHPMYSVGYAGYYAMSLLTFSPPVLFVSLAAHAAQFGFLNWFENPHIERVYGGGQRKPLAARTPLVMPKTLEEEHAGDESRRTRERRESNVSESGDVTETETLIEGEDEEGEDAPFDLGQAAPTQGTSTNGRTSRSLSTTSIDSSFSLLSPKGDKGVVSRHDLDNVYFRKDLMMFKNFDAFRTRDLLFGLLLFYSLLPWFLPAALISSASYTIVLLSINALVWRLFHTVILGLALKKQSEKNWIVRHFLKHYHYEEQGEAVKDAWENWKSLYNASLIMTYGSFLVLAWKCYSIPHDWTVASELVRHTLGLLLIALHIWSAQSTFEVLGPFGWFYGDFFIPSYPHELYYTGIYRFLNNPERSMGGAAFFGIVLISASKVVLVQALISVFAHWWFLSFVENPHMKRLYGNTLRKDAGVTKTLRNATKSHQGRKPPKVFERISKNVKEVQGTVEKVFEETEKALEEFLNKTGPAVKGYVQDTKLLLQQSGERLVISRVSTDLASYDQSRYCLSLRPSVSSYNVSTPHASTSKAPAIRYHLGEPISLDWTAPLNHSRRDWVGIYRLDGNVGKSQLVTKVSSQGKWVGIYDDEWRGDEYQEDATQFDEKQKQAGQGGIEKGKITFGGKKLPWRTGLYELRYHHDGKHSVMASAGPIEIFVEKPVDRDEPVQARETLTRIIAKTLSLDPEVIPASARYLLQTNPTTGGDFARPTMSSPSSSASSSSSFTSPKKKEKSKAIDQDAPSNVAATQESPLLGSSSASTFVDSSAPAQMTLSDPDDFILYTTEEASRISYAIKESFEIELDKEVVLAAANVGKLVKRVLEARNLLGFGQGTGSGSDRRDG